MVKNLSDLMDRVSVFSDSNMLANWLSEYIESISGDDSGMDADYYLEEIRQNIVGMAELLMNFHHYHNGEEFKADRLDSNVNLPAMDIPVKQLDITNRTLNCLLANDINSVRDLVGFRACELLKTPCLGRKSLHEIVDTLAGFNLRLRD